MEYRKFSAFIEKAQYGYTAEETSYDSGDAKYLRITDIVPYFVDKDRVPFCTIPENKKEQYLVKENDLLIARTGATTGYNLIVPKGFSNYIFASYLVRYFYNKDKLYPLYLKYVLKSQQYYGFVNNYIGGSAQPGMNPKAFGRFEIPYVNYEKQKKIAAVLSAYDNLIEVNNKRIKVLEQMAENLYKEWFVRFRFPGHETAEFENGIPKGWEYCLLDSIAFVTMGQSPESQYYNYDSIGLPFHQGVGSYGEYYLVDDMYSSQGVRIAEPNSIIFSVRAPVGRINLTLNRIILGRGVAGINSKEGKNWFLLYMLKHRFAAEDLIGNGSIFSSVKKEELLKQKFLVPSSALISKYDSTARKIEWQIRLAYLSNKNLIKQRDLLLPRLMSGKLEV